MTKDVLFNLRMSTTQKEKLLRLAEMEDRPVSQVIRLAINSYLAGKGIRDSQPSKPGANEDE
ncbi:MAG: hypothetical protein M0030_06850 [Actinomycetota bacterium]|nr:hypothetical protein [Actinomycetota bacterium]